MSWMDEIGNLLQQYSGGSQSAGNASQDFDQVAQNAPHSELADGVAAALRSNETPPMPDMVANLFGQSNGEQRASILNQLLASAGPGILSSVLGSGMLSGLGGMLSQGGHISPEQAQQIPPDAVKEIAAHAEQRDPSIVDRISQIYAQHPTLLKTLGEAALTIAMARMAQKQFPGR